MVPHGVTLYYMVQNDTLDQVEALLNAEGDGSCLPRNVNPLINLTDQTSGYIYHQRSIGQPEPFMEDIHVPTCLWPCKLE